MRSGAARICKWLSAGVMFLVSPLGLELLASLNKAPSALAMYCGENNKTAGLHAYRMMHAMLSTWHDALLVELIHHGGASGGVLVQGLLEQDGSRDVLAQAGGCAEQLAVCLQKGCISRTGVFACTCYKRDRIQQPPIRAPSQKYD